MSLKEIIKNPGLLFLSLGHRELLNWVNDETYLKLAYKIRTGKKLDRCAPVTYSEKLQWIKLHDRNSIYTQWVDKYEAKKLAASLIGEEYIIPTLGVWEHFDDINFDLLPDRFVLKCTHDSGGVFICKDKRSFSINSARKKIESSLRHNYYWGMREWPYKNVKPRIIAEKLIENRSQTELRDYKIFCCDSEPEMILVCSDRFSPTGLKKDFFDTEWNKLAIRRPGSENSTVAVKKPERLEDMLRLSSQIAEGKSFCRVDFYEVDAKLYFGELTFFPSGGFDGFEPEEYDRILGEKIHLNNKVSNQ